MSGELSRRDFLRRLGLLGAGISFSSALGCIYSGLQTPARFTSDQELEFSAMLDCLFPAKPSGPAASDINALQYFHFVLLDPDIPEVHKTLILNGIGWVQQESLSVYSMRFSQVDIPKQEKLMTEVISHEWGERWSERVLGYVFEALLADPIYGGNRQGKGWQWLEHAAGVPRPDSQNRYPKLS